MTTVKEVIVVEGRYDKNTVSQVVDAVIIETNGFGIRNDAEKLALLRRLALRRGIVVLTDSDSAGFMIRNYLRGSVPPECVKHAYIPDIHGKERRKTSPSKEGKLGVEGMDPETILSALRRAGATMDGCASVRHSGITKADLYELGLTGRPDSSSRRELLRKKLDLPEKLGTNALLDVLNALYERDEFILLASEGSDT